MVLGGEKKITDKIEIIENDGFISHEHCKNFVYSILSKKIIVQPELEFPLSFKTAFERIFVKQLDNKDLNTLLNFLKDNFNFFSNRNKYRVANQDWPNPNSQFHHRTMDDELVYSHRNEIISKNTKITSLGSCFAAEVAYWLQKNSYNYQIGKNATPNSKNNLYSSTLDWGPIFNTPSLVQLLEWVCGIKDRPFYLYKNKGDLLDPFCEEIKIKNNEINNYIEKSNAIIDESKHIFTNTDVVILTFGLNEVYQFIPNMEYIFRSPNSLNPSCFKAKVLTIDENVLHLKRIIELLKTLNNRINIIISVSPIPLLRSFRFDKHVAESTMLSKCILRLAVEEICKLDNVYYFPSFETAMYPGHGNNNVFIKDERHVEKRTVDKIMRTFEIMFCENKSYNNFSIQTNNNLSSDSKLSLEIAHQSLDDLNSKYILDHINFQKMRDCLSSNSIINNQTSETTYQHFRNLSILHGMEYNHIQGNYFKEAGNTNNLEENVNFIAQEVTNKGYCLVKGKDTELLNCMEKYFSKFPLTSLKYKTTSFHRDIVGNAKKHNHNDGDIKHYYDINTLPIKVIADYLNILDISSVAKVILGHIGQTIINGWTNIDCPSSNQDISRVALKFHFDLDKMGKWLKAFIFLNDVTKFNGPHVFTESSHRNITKNFHRDGRFETDEVDNSYPGLSKTILANAGDVLIADTIGLHRGSPLIEGHRDLLSITYCNTNFGKPDDTNVLNCYKGMYRELLD